MLNTAWGHVERFEILRRPTCRCTSWDHYLKLGRDGNGIHIDNSTAAALLRSGRIVDVDSEIALDASQLDLPLADSLIYTIARRDGATRWTQDEDFATLPGVKFFPKKP